MMKRILSLLMALGLLVMAGCTTAPQQGEDGPTLPPAETSAPEQTPDETLAPEVTLPPDDGERMQFTDSAGREVSLPAALTRMIPGNAEAQLALFALSPALVEGWYFAPGGSITIDGKELALPGEDISAFDWTSFKNAGAQAILIMGAGYSAADMDAVQEKAGLPVVFLSSSYEALAESYLSLGGLFGLEQEAQDIYLYLDTTLMELSDGTQEIPEDKRIKLYYGIGDDGLTAGDSPALALAGIRAAAEPGKAYTMEALKALGPDQIIFAGTGVEGKPGVFSTVMESEAWNTLPAVQMGLYYEIPNQYFDCVGDTRAANRIFGAKWLAALVYPEQFSYDMVEETRMFYDLFWHVQLTVEEAEALLEHSSLKPIG